MQLPGASVVSETFPEFENLFDRSVAEFFDGGEGVHPTAPERKDRLDLGLLEHDFRDPDGVRV